MNATIVARKSREDRRISKAVRKAAGWAGSPYPIKLVDGFEEPAAYGSEAYYTTPAGKPVYHPNAYRRAFGRPVYHHCTLEIVVGIGWVLENVIVKS